MRFLLIVCGICSLTAGVIGIVVPLLPTTPFVLLAGACFARSSPRFDAWLRGHRRFGPMLHDWEAGGVIRLRAKCWATALLSVTLAFPLLIVDLPWTLRTPTAMVGVLVLLFIWTRPSQLREPAGEDRPRTDQEA